MLTVGSFGFILFAALLAGLWRVTPQPRRWQLMLAASLVFYLSLDWQGCLLLCLMTLLVWQAALHLRGSPRWFYVGLAGALAPLTLLKLRPAALLLGQAFSLRIWDVSVPQVLGIGYFSLQLTSYLVDVRRGKQEPESQYARLLCFASFFLSITQGPFNRYGELMPQLDAAAPQPGQWQRGAQRCFWGYFKKLAVADRAALAVNAAFADPSAYDRSQLFLCAVLYVFQLYADFSGYTDIVLGAGEMLGLPLPENFRQPFLAATIRELWDRWHISLSRWLKDYVYIPLGGSRCSAARRDGNIIATFLVSGLSRVGLCPRRFAGVRKSPALAQGHHPGLGAACWCGRHIHTASGHLYGVPRQQPGQCRGLFWRHPAQRRPQGVQQLLGAGLDQPPGTAAAFLRVGAGHCR